MRKLLSVLMLFLVITCASAQERNADPQLSFGKKSEKLSAATGWMKSDGKWIDNANIISPFKVRSATGMRPNFAFLVNGIVTVNGKKYHVLVCQHVSGSYKYPQIEEDWERYTVCEAFIMDDKEYGELKAAIEKKEGKDIKIEAKFAAAHILGEYDEQKVLRGINDAIAHNSGDGMYSMFINSQNLKGQDVVRFNLPDLHSTETNLTEEYFETPGADFKKLLID